MKGQIKLYLGGTMSYYHRNNEYHKATEWRIKLAQKLLECNAELCCRHFDWFDPTVNFEENVKTANAKTIVHQNNHYLDRCDILIVNLSELDKSPGTIYELIYYGIQNKSVIAFGNNKLIHSPHISECITIILDDLDDIIEYLKNYYIQ